MYNANEQGKKMNIPAEGASYIIHLSVNQNTMEKRYRYLGLFMTLLIPLVFFAFYQSYFKRFPTFGSRIHIYDHIHATLAMIWIIMLIIQPTLIKNRRYKIHRIIGRISYIIFPLLILSFIPREIILFHSDDRRDLFFPVADSCVLVTLFALAIYNITYKKNVANHMRYIISSALVLLGPTIGRIGPKWLGWSATFTQYVQYAIIYAILVA